MRRVPKPNRSAFTLVELLMVITIIGILVGLIVPAVMYAMRKVKGNAIAMEVQTLAQAVEQYKNKVGDYPPDGSNKVLFERHFRKRFPQILVSEFTSLYRPGVANSFNGTSSVMDPPEALVFALGGFSSDTTKPFTGVGGPLAAAGTTFQYNVDRNEPLFDFKQAQLTLDTNAAGLTVSTDETLYAGGTATNDVLPCYHTSGKLAPFVYFDSRTYSFSSSGGTFFNYYGPSSGSTIGVARPYRSDNLNTKVTPSIAKADEYYRYAADRSFQILGAGLDDNFGNVPFPSPAGGGGPGPRFYAYPSGKSIDFENLTNNLPTVGQYSQFFDVQSDPNKYQQDNVANFADGVLADALPN